MSVFNIHPPIIDNKHLIQWLKTNFSYFKNKSLKLNKLNSERDINFIIIIKNKKKFVLKISNPSEKLDILKYQDRLIKHLRKNNFLKKYIPKVHHIKIAQYLAQKENIWINARTRFGNTAVDLAMNNHHYRLARMLQNNGGRNGSRK